MKKRILSLVAALALAATVVVPVQAAAKNADGKPSDGKYDSSYLQSVGKDDSSHDKDAVDWQFNTKSENMKSANSDLKPSGAANAKVNVVTGSAKDNLVDNGIKPVIKEFVKATRKGESGKCTVGMIQGIQYFDLTADAAGDVTFKIDDTLNAAMTGDNYAIVLHYTGNAADEDGITAQYCKISSAGKVTAHFNSFSPVAIISTTATSAQNLVNTYSHSAGSDAGNAAAVAQTPAVQAPVVDPNAQQAQDQNGVAGAQAANGKGAASPKTSDNAYAMYLILAVAAVAGTTLVATKKTR